MKCKNCGFENDRDAAFCEVCGGQLIKHCKYCGSEIPAGDALCSVCGKELIKPQIEEPTPAPRPLDTGKEAISNSDISLEDITGDSNLSIDSEKAEMKKEEIEDTDTPIETLMYMISTKIKNKNFSPKVKKTILLSIALIIVGVFLCINLTQTPTSEVMEAISTNASQNPGEGLNVIAAGGNHIVGLKKNGRVVAAGANNSGQRDVGALTNFKDIVAVDAGYDFTVALKKDGTVVVSDRWLASDAEKWSEIVAISAGLDFIAGLKEDGTVVATGSMSDLVASLSNIKAISAGNSHIVGLRTDDTVLAVGDEEEQLAVSNWADIIAVSAGYGCTFGLKKDGTVATTAGYNVSNWSNIVAISVGSNNHHVLGLKEDGTVVATGDNSTGQCDVSDWTNIVAISSGGSYYGYSVGIQDDGTIVTAGYNNDGQYIKPHWNNIFIPSMDWYPTIDASINQVSRVDFSKEKNKSIATNNFDTIAIKNDGTTIDIGTYEGRMTQGWTDIVSVSEGRYHVVGLKKDGTVVAVGANNENDKTVNGKRIGYGQCNVDNWTDIVYIAAGHFETMGIKKDGTVVAVGRNNDGECDVHEWNNIIDIEVGRSYLGGYSVGLKKNGTVILAGYIQGKEAAFTWDDIIEIATAGNEIIGIKKDGSVVSTGYDFNGYAFDSWTDIIAISAGTINFTEDAGIIAGLRADGTVVIYGDDNGECDVSNWKDIVQIAAGEKHIVGLKSDGTVVAVGDNTFNQCNVQEWQDILIP